MSTFVLKLIAIITMFIDHLGYVINNGDSSTFNIIGRIAFPIFAFQISEGYIHTKNLKKYFLRLFLFALISQIPFMLFTSIINNYKFHLNIMFTLLWGLLSIYIYDKCYNKFLKIILFYIIFFVACCLPLDYGLYGVAIILIFYIFKNNFKFACIFFILANLIKYMPQYIVSHNLKIIYYFIFTSIPILFFAYYNGKKGKDTKYLLYLFYPIHLLLLYAVSLIIK